MFDQAALNVFKDKGEGNSVKVRRIIQITLDLIKKDIKETSILDLGCGEGVYALEAAVRGAKNVTAIDGRDNRLKLGEEIAQRHGLRNVNFVVDDVRNVNVQKYGNFDVIYMLGLLYHLDEPEVFDILKNLYHICNEVLIIDTNIALSTPLTVKYGDKDYYGVKYIEHLPGDDQDLIKNKRIMHSIGNDLSFLPSKGSLIRFLTELGFSSVMECYSPLEANKIEGRITLIAIKGKKEVPFSYPFLGGMSEMEIVERTSQAETIVPFVLKHKLTIKQWIKLRIDGILLSKGFELKRKLKD